MNITGTFDICEDNAGTYSVIKNPTGVFTTKQTTEERPLIYSLLDKPYKMQQVSFNASRSWTGATSKEGESQAFNVMQPYLSVYIWKRTT